MLRPVLFAVAVAALVAPARAADPDLSGNWIFSYSTRAGTDQNFAILKVEMKDGKPVASVLATPGKSTLKVTDFEVDKGNTVKFNTSLGASFEGTFDKDAKAAPGSLGNDQIMFRASLMRTEKTEFAANEGTRRTDAPAGPAATWHKMSTAVGDLRTEAFREKDADKKKELTDKASAAQKELDEKLPELLREVVDKSAESPFAIDAATDLIRGAAKYKVTADEAAKFVLAIEKAAAPYGPRYARVVTLQTVETLVNQKGLEAAAVGAAEKLTKAFTDADPATYQSRVLSAYKTALERSSVPNKEAALKAVTASLEKVEAKLDTEYLAKVPPFKPVAFAGRKDTSANRVVVMELFTGAQCPPCVAADVAFDALQKAYKPTELVLIQYHLHIPGPDPLTNSDTVARAKFYGANSTPSTFFNGKSQAGGGGGMANAENKFKQYADVIDPLLEKTTDVKLAGKATRRGDKIDIAVEVTGGDGDDMRLRLLVVEENIKYVGGNALRFHHQVVRAMPGGADGVAVKDKTFKHTAAVDLADVRNDLTKYLDDYAANTRPFPKPERPMDMKALRVIALVQNDKTKEIAQAVQIEVEGQPAGTGGRR
jgi:hypothetical protein